VGEADDALARFNGMPVDVATARLRECCAATQWVSAMVEGRPYEARSALGRRSEAVLEALDWAGVRQALDAHPRIGERVSGVGREATWSRREQAATANSTEQTKAELVEANRAYEERFGHVFLIFATGRTDVEMLAAAHERLGNDETTERTIVRGELGRIVALRLERMLDA
jgi:2-oxo-4-hydroxy-4-carboxy-5-ureidoimidazoline decarboxylase